jgi:HD-GYP domain-containing protein (c-di-GMP phosphodiesterase class II)
MDKYTAIARNALVDDTKIDFDLFLKNDIGGQSRYVLFCHSNEHFTSERREQLLSRNIQTFYISSKDTNKYFQYQEKNLKNIVEDSSKSSFEKSSTLYQVAKNLTNDILGDPRSGHNIDRATEWVGSTVSHIIQNENTFSGLFKVTSHDYHTFTHSVNTSVIGLLFGKYLSLNPHELECLGTGLLLHDIGKSALPSEIINKRGNLTSEEYNIIKKHPKEGLDLLEHKKSIDGMSLKVVIQHHENNDGTGYPYGIGGSDIHLFGQIARIIDAYDAMTSDRPYAVAMKPFDTLIAIKGEGLRCFNEELLKEFICFLGLKDSRKKSGVDDILSTSSPIIVQ